MVDSRTCQGVSKSGSDLPRLITSFIVLTMSKKSRMPERGMSKAVALMRLRSDTESFFCMAGFHQYAEALVGFEHEMGGRGEHTFERRQPFADERGHLAQVAALDEQQHVVGAAHEIRRAHLRRAVVQIGRAHV